MADIVPGSPAILSLQDIRARRLDVFGATETLEIIVEFTIEAENIPDGSQSTSEADDTFHGIQTSAEPIMSTTEQTEVSQSHTKSHQRHGTNLSSGI